MSENRPRHPWNTPLSDDEAEWAELEPAWADFINAARTGTRIRRQAPATILGESFAQSHALLELNRGGFEGGVRFHLFLALVECAKSGVPMPYWAANALLEISGHLNRGDRSLHELFGADKEFPGSKKKTLKRPDENNLRLALYCEVAMLVHGKDVAINRALDAVLARPAFKGKIGKTKAREIYNAQNSTQQTGLAALKRAAKEPKRVPLSSEEKKFRDHVIQLRISKNSSTPSAIEEALDRSEFRKAIEPARAQKIMRDHDSRSTTNPPN